MILALEIALFIAGVAALIKGKIALGKDRAVVGTPARLLGIVAILPIPATAVISFAVGLVIGITQPAGAVQDFRWLFNLIEVVCALLTLAVVFGVGTFIARRQQTERTERELQRKSSARLSDADIEWHDDGARHTWVWILVAGLLSFVVLGLLTVGVVLQMRQAEQKNQPAPIVDAPPKVDDKNEFVPGPPTKVVAFGEFGIFRHRGDLIRDAVQIVAGQPVVANTYQANLLAAKVYRIQMQSNPPIVPSLAVVNAQGTVVAASPEKNGAQQVVIRFQPPHDGVYQIAATSTGGKATGSYMFTINERQPHPIALNDRGFYRESFDITAKSKIIVGGSENEGKAFDVHLDQNDTYAIEVLGRGLEQGAYAIVDANENVVALGGRVPDQVSLFRPKQSGQFTIFATKGGSWDTYEIIIEKVFPAVVAAPADVQANVEPKIALDGNGKAAINGTLLDAPRIGFYEKAERYRVYRLKMQEGKRYTIAVESPGVAAGFPHIRVFDFAGRQYGVGGVRLITFRPEETKDYRIAISNAGSTPINEIRLTVEESR